MLLEGSGAQTKLHVQLRLAIKTALLLIHANIGLDEGYTQGRRLLHRGDELLHPPEPVPTFQQQEAGAPQAHQATYRALRLRWMWDTGRRHGSALHQQKCHAMYANDSGLLNKG